MIAPRQPVRAVRWIAVGLAGILGLGCPSDTTTPTSNNLPPVAVVTAPTDGSILELGVPVQVTANASDADGSIVLVQFRDGPSFIDDDNTAPYAVSWTPVDLGSHTLTARATDNRGAVTVSPGIQVTVVVTGDAPPTVQLTAPADQAQNLTGPLILTANANDDQSVAGVQFQVDGQDAGPEDTAAPYADTLTSLLAYATGVHVVRARARDNTGHFSPWATAEVTFTGSPLPQGFSVSTFSGLPAGPIPTAMAFAPDGRLFVCLQDGRLVIIKNGSLLAKPFLTVPTTANGERGLLGVAFHPSFTTNGRVYVYYTSSTPAIHNRIARYVADGDTALTAETIIAELPNLGATNHNGGAIHFGLDGKLYVGVGENAVSANSQSLNTVLGKVLRFNDDGSIPGDNPFLTTTTGQNQSIWAMGLRNPFTFAIHPTTGRILIDDVGQSTWEEIDEGIAGANYGWPTTEGPTNNPAFVSPIYAYQHAAGLVQGIAIIGGAFYSTASPTFPQEYRENYFFADLGGGWINRMDPANGNAVYAFADNLGQQTAIQLGPDGAIYSLSQVGGSWVVLRFQSP